MSRSPLDIDDLAGSCGAVTAYTLTPLIGSGFSAALITLTMACIVGTAGGLRDQLIPARLTTAPRLEY